MERKFGNGKKVWYIMVYLFPGGILADKRSQIAHTTRTSPNRSHSSCTCAGEFIAQKGGS